MSDSSNYSNQHHLSFGSHGQVSILASCYMATNVSETVKGFHYCTPNGAGMCIIRLQCTLLIDNPFELTYHVL